MKKNKVFKKKKLIIALLICIIIAAGSVGIGVMKTNSSADTPTYLTSTVTKGDISVSINSSGTLEASKRAAIQVVNDVTVDTVNVTEGDRVEKGDILMTLTDDSQASLEIARLDYEDTVQELNDLKSDLKDLTVIAPVSGTIDLYLDTIGETLSSGSEFAEISNEKKMKVVAPYNPSIINNISVGDSAEVLLYSYLQTIEGTVTKVGSTAKPYSDGALHYEVTVEIENPGALSTSEECLVTINNGKGSFKAMDAVNLSDVEGNFIRFDTSAELKKLYVSDGDYVNKGDKIAVFTSDSLESQISSQERSVKKKNLEYTQKLENYVLESPISGTVLSVNFQEGDSIESNETVFVISDIDTLQVVVPIDEYDIQDVYEGQTAIVTTQAYPDTEFEAEVTKVGLEGTASSGVSTFDVTLSLKTSEGLRPGMNVDADIIIDSSEDTLLLPVEAVSERDNQYAVLKEGEKEFTPIQIGLISDTYAEILEGLSEGDVIQYTAELGSGEIQNGGGMMMPGGGGPPSGGGRGPRN